MNSTQEPLESWTAEPSDIRTASLEALKAIVTEHQLRCFVWETDRPDYKPLLIDAFPANAMMTVYDALSTPDNKAKFERMIAANRGSFGRLVDFTWKQF